MIFALNIAFGALLRVSNKYFKRRAGAPCFHYPAYQLLLSVVFK